MLSDTVEKGSPGLENADVFEGECEGGRFDFEASFR